jgi:hypothetical protein
MCALQNVSRNELKLDTFLNSAPDGGESSPSRSSHPTPRESIFDAYGIGHYVGLAAGTDVTKRKFFLTPGIALGQLVASHFTRLPLTDKEIKIP